MKNLFKFGFFALAISLSVAACNNDKAAEETADSTSMDSMTVDTAVVDTAVVVDSAATDSVVAQ